MADYSNNFLLFTNEKVKKGTYACTECAEKKPYFHKVNKDGSKLPVCPQCQGMTWINLHS